jgi:hypothetical protein
MREGTADIPQAADRKWPQWGAIRGALFGQTEIAVKANGLTAQHQPHHLQLGEEHVEFGQLRLARTSQVARWDVDDLIGVAEVRGAHVFRIGSRA